MINTSFTIHDTFTLINSGKVLELAISPKIDFSLHRIDWQDASLLSKSLSFKKINVADDKSNIEITSQKNEVFEFKLLTKKDFEDSIKGNVPERALNSDLALRGWYQTYLRNHNDPSLYD